MRAASLVLLLHRCARGADPALDEILRWLRRRCMPRPRGGPVARPFRNGTG